MAIHSTADRELSLPEMLADPIVRSVMARDGVTKQDLEGFIGAVRGRMAARQMDETRNRPPRVRLHRFGRMTTAAADNDAGTTEIAMEALLYFAFWAGLIFLMMRFGCGAHVMGHGHGNGQAKDKPGNADSPEVHWVPPKKDTDPVCGKSVATDKAKPSVYGGNVYYFYSRECREVFEAAPDINAGGGGPNQPKLEHSHA